MRTFRIVAYRRCYNLIAETMLFNQIPKFSEEKKQETSSLYTRTERIHSKEFFEKCQFLRIRTTYTYTRCLSSIETITLALIVVARD